MRCLDRFPIAGVLGVALLASGCSGGSGLLGAPPAAPAPTASAAPAPAASAPSSSASRWLPSNISDFFSGSSDKGAQPVVGAAPDVECPYIDVREGASTLTIRTGGNNPAMSLKYEGTLVRAARQCALVNGQMVMKVGVEGRIVLGPQGAPGEITVPLRIAIVDQSPGQLKTILTKLILIPVTVASLDDNPSFSHVEDGLAFPMPASGDLDDYLVYIGFDPIAAQAQQRHERPRGRVKHKPKAATTG
jgi:hypothetical protein